MEAPDSGATGEAPDFLPSSLRIQALHFKSDNDRCEVRHISG